MRLTRIVMNVFGNRKPLPGNGPKINRIINDEAYRKMR